MDRVALIDFISSNASDEELYALYLALTGSRDHEPDLDDPLLEESVDSTDLKPEVERSENKPALQTKTSASPAMGEVGFANTRVCPLCGEKGVIKYGHKNGQQRFKCKACNHVFVPTTNTVMSGSHQSYETWREVIHDTLAYVSLEETAERLELSKPTVFNMRHKILLAMEDVRLNNPVVLSEVTELDETYVLESFKGSPIPEDLRPPRKRGAKASKRGLSSEQVCICTGVQRNKGPAMFTVVNRANPTKEEVLEAFDGKISPDALVLVDGMKSYSVLEKATNCKVVNAKKEPDAFYHLNNVNSLHSYFKSVYRHYRGVATKYSNRYGNMLGMNYRHPEALEAELLRIICGVAPESDDHSHTETDVKRERLTTIQVVSLDQPTS